MTGYKMRACRSQFLTLSALSLSASAIFILSSLHIEQLSVVLGTELLILNSIYHSILENLMLFYVVNLAGAVVFNFLRILYLFCCHLVLNDAPIEQMYYLSLTFALYTPFIRHSLLNGQFILVL